MAHKPIRYWIDWLGYLWQGPTAPEETMHYARFEGFTTHKPKPEPIWVLRRSAAPDVEQDFASEISVEAAGKILGDWLTGKAGQAIQPRT